MKRRKTDRPHPWAMTPYFKATMLALVLLGLAFCTIWNHAWGASTNLARAPVVVPSKDESIMVQVGWYSYVKSDTLAFLYCVPKSDRILTCSVYVVTPKGAGIMLTEVEASEGWS